MPDGPTGCPRSGTALRSQLICLPSYADTAVARQLAFTYAALSGPRHFRPYELAPTAAELSRWITDVEKLLTQLVPAQFRDMRKGVADAAHNPTGPRG